MKRLIKKGLEYNVAYVVPGHVRRACATLPAAQSSRLFAIWKKQWRRTHVHRLTITNIDQYENFVSWNPSKLHKINDEWFKKLALHVSNVEWSNEIDAALRLHLNPDYEQIKRYIGHLIFAKVSTRDIAKQWNMLPGTIEALAHLFFDFSALPKSPVAQWATLVQWVNNGDIKPDEFSLYKRVHELGPLGLKAQVAGAFLEDSERLEVKDYLGKTAMTNTFNIQFATRTPRDAMMYNRVVGDLVKMDLWREEQKLRQAEQRMLDMQVQKLGKELATTNNVEGASEDLKLIQSAIDQLVRQDSTPQYKTVFDLSNLK